MTQIETVCLVSMFAGIISAAIPQGKLKSAFSSFCAVAIIFYMVTPLAQIRTEGLKLFSLEIESSEEELLSDVRSAEVMLYESLIEKSITQAVEKMGYRASIKALCESRGDDEIRVISFTVSGTFDANAEAEIENFLKEGFNGVAVNFEEVDNG